MSDNVTNTTISGHADPEGEAPWAMQLVVHVPKQDQPTENDALVAAARAVAALLCDQRSQPGGAWHSAVDRWLQGRIRKITRRARGAAWTAATQLEGVVAAHGRAEVFAAVPGPTDDVPAELRKLQVSGLELDRDQLAAACEAAGPTVTIAVNPAVQMSTGKLAAQVAHAANIAVLEMPADRLAAWSASGFPIMLLRPDAAGWDDLTASANVVVTDAGFTEIPAGTQTTLARWS